MASPINSGERIRLNQKLVQKMSSMPPENTYNYDSNRDSSRLARRSYSAVGGSGDASPVPADETTSWSRSLTLINAGSKFMRSARRAKRTMSESKSRSELEALGQAEDEFEVPKHMAGVSEAQLEAKPSECLVLWHMLTQKWLNVLLIFIPIAVAGEFLNWGPTVAFCTNFIAMVPLASMLGDFTEEVAAHTNQTIGGLVNATFGNAVEVVVALQALHANQIRVVQASLMGSVFSNMLLVLGCCFFCGGLYHKEQKFNSTSAVANMSLLMLSSLALVLPTPLAAKDDTTDVLLVSRLSGIFLFLMYLQLLYFQLKTHTHIYDDDDEEEEVPDLSMSTSIAGLLVVTLAVSVHSEFLVNSIDGFTEEANLSKTFVGIILLPIIGNAVEHVTAVTVAIKDKMELAMGVAIGSATQVSMFVVPVTVLSGWAMGREMTLAFPIEEVTLYVLSVIIVATTATTGSSNWLLGSLLITTYVLVGVAFWFEGTE